MNQLAPALPKENSVFLAVSSRTTWVIVVKTVARFARIGAGIAERKVKDES